MRSKHARLSDWRQGDAGGSEVPSDDAQAVDAFMPSSRHLLNERRTAAPQRLHETPRILVAEADPYHRRVLRMLLASPSLSTIEVEDGQSAVDLLSLRSFDLILLAMDLPLMTGEDVLRWVRRSHTPWADIPIVGLVDETQRDRLGRLLSMGLTDWTPKPLDRADLSAKLVNFMPGLAGSGL